MAAILHFGLAHWAGLTVLADPERLFRDDWRPGIVAKIGRDVCLHPHQSLRLGTCPKRMVLHATSRLNCRMCGR